jgi:ABC-type phosphate transport system substrate-binding protein
VNTARLERPEIREFLRFAFSQMHDVVVTVGYVPLPAPDHDENTMRLESLLEG